MKCEMCQQEHIGEYGSGRFCAASCAKKFSTSKINKKQNKKTAQTLKNKINSNKYGFSMSGEKVQLKYAVYKKVCTVCNIEFITNYKGRNKKYCSKQCQNLCPVTRKKIGEKRIQSILNGNVGYGIKCEYQDIRCDSALEYAFLAWYKKKHPDARIKRFEGVLQDEDIVFIPDFIIDDEIIVEVKYDTTKFGQALQTKWHQYISTLDKKRKILDDCGKKYLWVTNLDIGMKFYRSIIRELKAKSH